MNWIRKNKWTFWWLLFGVFVIIFIFYIIEHISRSDFNSALLQFGSIIIPLFAAIIIMLQNNEQIDRSTKIQLDHLQKLNDREIEELQKLFQKQIDVLTENTNKQILEFKTMTNEQIKSLQENTNKQILSYTEQTQKVIDELSDNAILLGEILKRELEKGIQHANQQIKDAEKTLEELKGFILGRSEEDKAQQIKQQTSFITWWKGWRDRLKRKHKALLETFQEDLNG
ncbi:hypothetical protein [Limnovirga soli]|uniref:Uncharacterized protein n=1 Tax=Limnovirga soli TaxID=2656915 RepID=A0A8J8FFL1_9BACT|nr:hypothetical protein [Limnovirga soli]NNV55006.1 hypothetical protein [Limnovirga soli]